MDYDPKFLLYYLITIKIYDVHDGDTINVIMNFGDYPVKMSIRILGIDTPETRAGEGRLREEKLASLKARQYVREVLGEYTMVKLKDWDKYGGRMLGEVSLPDGSILIKLLLLNLFVL